MDVYFKCESSAVIAQLTASESGDWKVAPKIPGAHLEGTSTSDGSIINIGGTSSYTRGIIQGAVYAGDQFDVYFKSSVYVRDGGESVFVFVLAHIFHIFSTYFPQLLLMMPCGCNTESRLCNSNYPTYKSSLTPEESMFNTLLRKASLAWF